MAKIKLYDEETEKLEDAYNASQSSYENSDSLLKNKSFVQFYDDTNDKFLQLMLKDPTAATVFVFLARFAENNNTIKVGIKQIGEILKKSDSTIKRAIRKLIDLNFMTIIKDGRDNIYFLNPRVVCNTNAKYKSNLYHQYLKMAESTLVNDVDKDIMDLKKYTEFIGREKQIYKFAFTSVAADNQTDEFMRDFEGFAEYRENQKTEQIKSEIPDNEGDTFVFHDISEMLDD